MNGKPKFQLGDVIYNAAAEQFEALATVHRDGERVRVACRYKAPMTTEFEDTVDGLLEDAARQIAEPGLRARLSTMRRERRKPSRPDLRWHHAILDRVWQRLAA